MGFSHRLLIALGILALDIVFFVLPLSALFLGYVILYNPPWFRDFLNRLDGPNGKNTPSAGLY